MIIGHMIYDEEDMLMLSGIQHYVFCPRQWALIHLEQLWHDNILTVEGKLLHERVDNPEYRAKRGELITLRRVPIASKILGLAGFSDAVELRHVDSHIDAITHKRYSGYWQPIPIEYKRGRAKPNRCDEVQVAAQAICLEEMYGIRILRGMIFYNEEKGRHEVELNEELRSYTKKCSDSMHQIYRTAITPSPVYSSRCKCCSLYNLCMPSLEFKHNVQDYLNENIYEKAV